MEFQRSSVLVLAAALVLGLTSVSGLARPTRVAGALAASADRSAARTVANLQTAFDGESNAARPLHRLCREGRCGRLRTRRQPLPRGRPCRGDSRRQSRRRPPINGGGSEGQDRGRPPLGRQPRIWPQPSRAKAMNATRCTRHSSSRRRRPKTAKRSERWISPGSAEAEHARLYQEALSNIAAWRGAAKAFYVCPVCGFTTSSSEGIANCPSCFTPKEQFLTVSRPGDHKGGDPMFPPLPTDWSGFHPLVIHFPIALLLVAPVLVVVAMVARNNSVGHTSCRRSC